MHRTRVDNKERQVRQRRLARLHAEQNRANPSFAKETIHVSRTDKAKVKALEVRMKNCPPACHRKRGWESEEQALHILAVMMLNKQMDRPLPVPYYCPTCGLWRLGRKPEKPPE